MFTMGSQGKPVFEFNYDITCPFAYIASTRIEALATRANAELVWSPVLLGGIYGQTAAPQGAAGSASDVFNAAKKSVSSAAFNRTLSRYNIPLNQPSKHPQRSASALRLILSLPDNERPALSKALFKAYWVDNKDISDRKFLIDVARKCGISRSGDLNEAVFDDIKLDETLRNATSKAVSRGAPGVPSFWIPDEKWTDFEGKSCQGRLYWGQDRMHFVEASLIALNQGIEYHQVTQLSGLQPRCLWNPKQKTQATLEFWYDFSSPWAFLGWTQLEQMKREAGPGLKIEMKPILLGALFREIGAPMLPMLAISPQKRAYMREDQTHWIRHWNALNTQSSSSEPPITLRWPDVFPIRSPTLLRISIVEPKTISVLYRACWEQNVDVSTPATLASFLTSAGFDADALIKAASQQGVKDQLRANTEEAQQLGLCGVPTYRVLNVKGSPKGGIVWGQDELGTVMDLIHGWREGDDKVADVKGSGKAML